MYFLQKLFSLSLFEKCDFQNVVKIPYPENHFLVTLRSFSSTYKLFPGLGWLFLVSKFELKFYIEKMSSIAGLKKVFKFLAEVLILAIFGSLGPPSKSVFSTYRQNFSKSFVYFLGEIVRNIVLNFELSIFSGLWGVAVLPVDIFRTPWF